MGPSLGKAKQVAKSVKSKHQSTRRKASLAAAQILPADQPNDNTVRFSKSPMQGDLPLFNDWANIVVDYDGHKLYIYGGCRPNDNTPTSDFYTCDLETMRWSNLTNKVHFSSNPGDPFGNAPSKCPLPALRKAATTFLHLNGRNFVLIFGGFRPKQKTTSADLYAVDVDDLTWWVVHVEGGPVAARMCACIVAVETRLYIFGGTATPSSDDVVLSFCIAEYSPDGRRWEWTIRDQPYPEHMPDLGHAGEAIPVYDGKKIMLTRGRTEDVDPINLSCETTVLFHTDHHTFQAQTGTIGDFPQNIAWYQLQGLPSALKQPPGKSILPPSRSRTIRRPAEPFQSGSSTVRVDEPDTASKPMTSSVLMCAWIPHADGYLVPEVWQYLLPPDERFRCLDLREKLWNLDLDLQMFIVSGSRLFFMGYEGPLGPGADEEDPIWNVCIEMFLEGLA